MGEHWPVLTVRQPWCWSIEHGGKPVENRGRYMKYRGPLWLHSGARSRWDPAGADSYLVQQAWLRYLTGISSAAIELAQRDYGARARERRDEIGAARVARPGDGLPSRENASGDPQRCGAHERAMRAVGRVGRCRIQLADVRPLPEPVPCRGMLGLGGSLMTWTRPFELNWVRMGSMADRSGKQICPSA